MRTIEQIASKVEHLRQRNRARDARMRDVFDVRTGNVSAVLPGMFPVDWPKPIVANFIDTVARDLAEMISPMPSINCASASMTSERARKFADRRTKIANYYAEHSRLSVKLTSGADRYITYGFLPFVIEPDFDKSCPIIRLDDPMNAHYEEDIKGRVHCYAKTWKETTGKLVARFPWYEQALKGSTYRNPYATDAELELVSYVDDDQYVLYVPARDNLVLAQSANRLGKCPVTVAVKPSLDDEARGQFDDVIWVQLARAKMMVLQLEAAEKSVNAPMALPSDVQQMSFGPDAIMRSATPEKIRRVGLELSQATFTEPAVLQDEMRTGTRYPEGRSGQINASVVTGRGIQELLGGFDSQIQTAQRVIGEAMGGAFRLAFEMDEKFWPDMRKTVTGVSNGTPYEEGYVPSRDIAGDYTVDIQYGFAAGMDPNRAVVMLLQLLQGSIVSIDFVQRQLPMDLDVDELQRQIDIEAVNAALRAGLQSMLNAAEVLAAQGMDPTAMLQKAATVIEARTKGTPLHEAVLKAFAPEPAPAPPPEQESGLEGALTPGSSAPPPAPEAPSAPPAGPPIPGAPPGAAGSPNMASLLAGLLGR